MLSIFPLPIKTHIKKVEWKTKGKNLTSHSLLSNESIEFFCGFSRGIWIQYTHDKKSQEHFFFMKITQRIFILTVFWKFVWCNHYNRYFMSDFFRLRSSFFFFLLLSVARPGRNCKQDNDIFNGNLLSFELWLRHQLWMMLFYAAHSFAEKSIT